MEPTTHSVTNQSVAERLNLDHSMVSRIRSGKRIPSFSVMQEIQNQYGWPVTEQSLSRVRDTYAEDFEKVINED